MTSSQTGEGGLLTGAMGGFVGRDLALSFSFSELEASLLFSFSFPLPPAAVSFAAGTTLVLDFRAVMAGGAGGR